MKKKVILFFGRLIFLLLLPLVSIVHYKLNTYRPGVRSLETVVDTFFPFKPIFAIPYLYWFAFIYIVLVYFAATNGRVYFKLLGSTLIGIIVCEIIFYFFPTTVLRPALQGDGILLELVRFIYSNDNPYNCFPSIHVLNATLGTMFFNKYGKEGIYKVLVNISCILIALSTLYLKQHYILDAVASVLIASILFWIFESTKWVNLLAPQRYATEEV